MSLRGGQQGYTLVEVLIAITIFAVGLLSLAGMQVTAIQTNSTANTMTAATALAEGVMEEILAWSAGDPRVGSDADDIDWDFGGGQTTKFINGAGAYSAVYRVDADAPVANVSTITVTVSGAGRQVVLSGYKQYVD